MYTKACSQSDSTALAVFCDTHTHTQAARWVSGNLCCCLSSHFFKSLDNFELYHSHLSQGRRQNVGWKSCWGTYLLFCYDWDGTTLSVYTKAASKPSFIVYLWFLWGWWPWFRLICDFLSCSYSGASVGLRGGRWTRSSLHCCLLHVPSNWINWATVCGTIHQRLLLEQANG